jgi:hypothetical protein
MHGNSSKDSSKFNRTNAIIDMVKQDVHKWGNNSLYHSLIQNKTGKQDGGLLSSFKRN